MSAERPCCLRESAIGISFAAWLARLLVTSHDDVAIRTPFDLIRRIYELMLSRAEVLTVLAIHC